MTHDLDTVLLFLLTCDRQPRLKQANLGNALAVMKSSLGETSWVGLYLATPTDLILGPFQGTHACEVIAYGKGVVGTCFSEKKTVVVKDVSTFPGYICCDTSAKSEICVPIRHGSQTLAILDIDLPYVHEFEKEEVAKFEEIATHLADFL